MPRTRKLWWAVVILGASGCALAQSTSQGDTGPAPAFGQPNAPILSPENPPVTGLDSPALELRSAMRSFISPALQVSESADTNPNNQFNVSNASSITRLLGAFDLQQFWPKSDLFLEYVGGGAFYADPSDVRQLHTAGLEGVTRWRTGQVTLRDAASYLPDGAFNMGFGGFPGLGIATGQGFGTNSIPGMNGSANTVGSIPRLSNTAVLDAVQAINPISAITTAVAFSNGRYYDHNPDPNQRLINSDEITIQGGYARLLNRHDQIGVVYAYQLFQFPQARGGQVDNQIVNIRWSHTISGRMSFTGGIGPQYTNLQTNGTESPGWSVAGKAQLHYKFAHSSLLATYEKFIGTGSGLSAGSKTQAARLGYIRPVGRTWEFHGDLSYSHNQRLQALALGSTIAPIYDEGSLLAMLRKHLGRNYDFFFSYRFSEVGFNSPTVIDGIPGTITRRQAGTIGIEWHPRPTKIE